MRTAMLRDLAAHKQRVAMMLVAIALGVAATVAAWIAGDSIPASLVSAENNTTVAVSVRGELSTDDAAALAELSGVDSATTVATTRAGIVGDDGKLVPTVSGFDVAGTGWDDTGRFALDTGRAPQGADQIALNHADAERAGLRPGDPTELLLADGQRARVEVTGVYRYRTLGEGSDDPTPAIAFGSTEGRAMEILRVDLDASDPAAVADAATALVGSRAEVRDGAWLAEVARQEAASTLTDLRMLLLPLAGLALLVGMFIIANTFAMLVAQRSRQLALLRAVGARRGQVRRVMLLEALVLSLVGGTLGVLAGVALGPGLLAIMSDTEVTYVVSPTAIAIGYVSAAVVTVLAALGAARRAAAVPPLAALRGDGVGRPTDTVTATSARRSRPTNKVDAPGPGRAGAGRSAEAGAGPRTGVGSQAGATAGVGAADDPGEDPSGRPTDPAALGQAETDVGAAAEVESAVPGAAPTAETALATGSMDRPMVTGGRGGTGGARDGASATAGETRDRESATADGTSVAAGVLAVRRSWAAALWRVVGRSRAAAVGSVLLTVSVVVIAVTASPTAGTAQRIAALSAAAVGAVAMLLSAPRLLAVTLRVVGRSRFGRGPATRLAVGQAMADPRRASGTAVAVTIGMVLVCAFATLNATLADLVASTTRSTVPASTTVVKPAGSGDSSLTQSEVDAVVDTEGVTTAAASTEAIATLEYDGDRARRNVSAIVPEALGTVLTPEVTDGIGDLRAGFVVARNQADTLGMAVGDRVTIRFDDDTTVTDTVAGVYEATEYSASLYVDADRVPSRQRERVEAVYATGTDAEAALQRTFADRPDVRVTDVEGLVSEVLHQQRLAFVIFYVMFALSLLIALFGVVNTLTLSVLERAREIGVLRAIGAPARLVRRMVRVESLIVAGFGAVLGAVTGVGVGTVMQQSMLGQPLWNVTVPVSTLGMALVAAAVAAVLAAVWPARRAARADVLGAIAVE